MFYGLGQFAHEERLALDLVELFKTEFRELGAEIIGKLAAVKLTYEHFLE